jgi:hypothetical protein
MTFLNLIQIHHFRLPPTGEVLMEKRFIVPINISMFRNILNPELTFAHNKKNQQLGFRDSRMEYEIGKLIQR